MECISSLSGHIDRVWHVAWSPDGEMLATCGADKSIRIYSKKSNWKVEAILEDTQSRTIRSCEFSPCSCYLAAASFDATTVIWQRGRIPTSLEEEWQCVSTLEGHENEVKSVSWSCDGKLLATCSRDKSIYIWEAPRAATPGDTIPDEEVEVEVVSVLTGAHTQDVKFVKFHPLRPLLFSASYDNSILLSKQNDQMDDYEAVAALTNHGNTVWGLALAPDGETLASCSQDCTVRIWHRVSGENWQEKAVLADRHDRTIFSIDWSSDGKLIATSGADDTIILQSGESYDVLARQENAHDSDVNCVRFNPKDPTLVASAGDDALVKLWRYTS